MSDVIDQLTDEIRERVARLGFELVDLRRKGSADRVRLQVRLDRPDSIPGHGITIDECASVSRALEAWLDSAGSLGTRYVLEVSSPGIERPVRWPEHWRRFVGRDVRVRIPDRGRVRATIQAVEGGSLVLRLGDGEDVTIPVGQARDATLIVDWDAIGRS